MGQFAVEYMTLDACYRLAVDQKLAHHDVDHSGRPELLCDRFGITPHPALFAAFAKLRNGLFHEAVWGGQSITGSAFKVYEWSDLFPGGLFEPVLGPIILRRLNVRLIAGVLGYGRPHTRPDWREMNEGMFLPPSQHTQVIAVVPTPRPPPAPGRARRARPPLPPRPRSTR